jgi:hypothetical protein
LDKVMYREAHELVGEVIEARELGENLAKNI